MVSRRSLLFISRWFPRIPWKFRQKLNRAVILSAIALFLFMSFIVNFIFHTKIGPNHIVTLTSELHQVSELVNKFSRLQKTLKKMLDENLVGPNLESLNIDIPIIIVACKRSTVKLPLESLINIKKSLDDSVASKFPIYVSHACDHGETSDTLLQFKNQITILKPSVPLLNTTDNSVISGYRHVSHHYKWALDQIFVIHGYSAAIVIEDDLDVSPDILNYFKKFFPLLKRDPTLFCISAYNDNGRAESINILRPDLFYRTDFFPGLGWMLLQSFWMEIRDQWPDIYWDEYIRKSYVRKNRSCIRPEISRTVTFGRIGVSRGQYFDNHLKFIVLNKKNIDYKLINSSEYEEPYYSEQWKKTVYDKSIEVSLEKFLNSNELEQISLFEPIVVIYNTRKEFESIASKLNLMKDFKSGVCRNAFRGIVPVYWNNHRIYIAPPKVWTDYHTDWI